MDQQDFEAALPLLDGTRRRRLAALIEQVHPGHRWLTDLRPDGGRTAEGPPDGPAGPSGPAGPG